jgi:hypothetical protein
MDTYHTEWEQWKHAFVQAVHQIPLYRLGVGLMSDGITLSEAEWHTRFALIESYDLSAELEVCVWRLATIDSALWGAIYHFMNDAVALSARPAPPPPKPRPTPAVDPVTINERTSSPYLRPITDRDDSQPGFWEALRDTEPAVEDEPDGVDAEHYPAHDEL